jgi:hypothetical protein
MLEAVINFKSALIAFNKIFGLEVKSYNALQ